MAKDKKENEEDKAILKLPVILDEIKSRKMRDDFGVTFGVNNLYVDRVKPLMDCIGDAFCLMIVRLDEKEDIEKFLENGQDADPKGLKL
jgi:hypothetical protein